MKFYSEIIVHQLELAAHLGWTKEERLKKQPILLDIFIRFATIPTACTTDELTDTCCYDNLTQKIKAFLLTREFRLIEKLGFEIYKVIKESLTQKADVKISVMKHPHPYFASGGVQFSYGDWQ